MPLVRLFFVGLIVSEGETFGYIAILGVTGSFESSKGRNARNPRRPEAQSQFPEKGWCELVAWR